jgi:hypothetical protein
MALAGATEALCRRWTSLRYVLIPAWAVLIGASGLAAHHSSLSSAADSWEARDLVLGVQAIASRHPGKTIYLAGVTDHQFWNSFYDHPFQLVTAQPVLLAPDNVDALMPFPELCDFHDYSQPVPVAIRQIEQGQAVVYQAGVDVTAQHLQKLKQRSGAADAPSAIPLGDPGYSYLLTGEWYVPESGYRWMGKSAQAVLSSTTGGHLTAQGFCAKPVELTVSVNGTLLRRLRLSQCDQPFFLSEPILPGRMEVRLEVDHTARVGVDQRDLGVALEYLRVVP